MHVVQTSRQGKYEVRADKGILGIASIDGIAGESRAIAQIFHVVIAVPAIAVHASQPRNADTRSERELRCGAFEYLPHDLMTRNELRFKRRELSFHDVQVRATNAASNDAKQNMSGAKLWTGNFGNLKKRSRRVRRRRKNGSFHFVLPIKRRATANRRRVGRRFAPEQFVAFEVTAQANVNTEASADGVYPSLHSVRETLARKPTSDVYGAGSTRRLEKYASVLTRVQRASLPWPSPSFRSFTIKHGCAALLT